VPPRDDLIIVLDTEETGNGPDDELIEFGAVMLSAPDLRELDAIQVKIMPSVEAYDLMMQNKIVLDMHQKSGLYYELSFDGTADMADQQIIDWLRPYTDKRRTHIPYSGAGVSWFDRKYIDKALPRFSKRITHWAYDVSVLRRTFLLADAETFPEPEDGKLHRALSDARHHADELRFYIEQIKKIKTVELINHRLDGAYYEVGKQRWWNRPRQILGDKTPRQILDEGDPAMIDKVKQLTDHLL
jgi:oligoribonuclease (3'-5' exoribonuclease)